MKNAIVALTLCIASTVSVHAAKPVGASFLTIPQSPVTASLGGAGSATASDVSSLYINPAGLSAINVSQIMASHIQLFQDSSLSSFAFCNPYGAEPLGQTIGFGVTYLNYGSMEARGLDRSADGSFRSSDFSATLSYARRVGPLTAGINLKGIQQRIANYSATGVAADLGTQWKTPIKRLQLGLSMTNLGPSMKFVSEKYDLPATTRIGAGYSFGIFNILSDVGISNHGGKTWYALGTEFTPVSILSLRAGYFTTGQARLSDKTSASSQLAKFAGLSGGVGLKIGRYQVDYAMTPHVQLGYTQQLSILMNFR